MKVYKTISIGVRSALLAATALSGLIVPAYAQESKNKAEETVVVTGYRASLRSAINAKKQSVDFTETIFSEDIGKFPDLNMAEAMQRVPGMIVQRDSLSGEGSQIAVRGLPSAFTLVSMNGNRVAVASDFGFTGSSSPNRQVDLDMFPTGLFNRVDVRKTQGADRVEGGIAGSVDMQNARPFDNKGQHLVVIAQNNYSFNAEKGSPRITAVANKTWDKFGVLVGYTNTTKHIFSDGFETVGWGDPNLANFCTGCDPGASFPTVNGVTTVVNPAGSNQFRFSDTVYSYTGNGLTPGALSQSQLLALNPGLTLDQLKGAIIPRLGRNYYLDGTSKNEVGLVALEARPSEKLKVNLDILHGKASRSAERSNMMWAVRNTGPGDDYNGGMIPLNLKVDANNVVTSGRFANSNFFEETNFYEDKTDFTSLNLSLIYDISDTLKFDMSAANMESTYERDVTFIKMRTAFQSTVNVDYTNTPGNDIPTIVSSVDLNSTTIGWRVFLSNLFLQRDRREVNSTSLRANLTKTWGEWTFKTGAATDEFTRKIKVTDNSAAFRNAWAAAIPDAQLPNYLKKQTTNMFANNGVTGAGYTQFVTPDFAKFAAVTNYAQLIGAEGNETTGTTYNGAGASDINEKVKNAYIMANNTHEFGQMKLKTNFGVRYQETDQTITSPSSVNGQIIRITTNHKYSDYLPSLNSVLQVNDNLNIRFAASKTMTRANPSDMSSQLGFSDPSAQSASQGNPALKPFYSTNYDFGGEYYFSKNNYVGLTAFSKEIENFVVNRNIVVPFSQLGVPVTSLSSAQQGAMAVSANTTVANLLANPSIVANNSINLSTKVNLDTKSELKGLEAMWVQPLDFVTEGLGFSVNYTSFGDTTLLSIPKSTYNVTTFYENGPFSARVSYVNVGVMKIGFLPSPNSIPYDWFQKERYQIDMSASYKFKAFGVDQSITLDATNLDNQGFRGYLGFENIPYQYTNAGRTLLLGWRAQF